MLLCPSCSSTLSIARCRDNCCTRSTDTRFENLSPKTNHFTEMGVNFMTGAVLQHPHIYQNSTLGIDSSEKIGPFPSEFLQSDQNLKSSSQSTQKSLVHPQVAPILPLPHISSPNASCRLKELEQEKQLQIMQKKLLLLEYQLLQTQLQQNRIIQHQLNQGPNIISNTTDKVTATREQLKQSGWYYGHLSWQESEALLINCNPGTFLVRDSQHPGCYFSLSFQQHQRLLGPTSIRIQFSGDKFSLDADDQIKGMMPKFDTIGELVQYYQHPDSTTDSPVILTHPLYHTPPSLAHSARLVINKRLGSGKTGSQSTSRSGNSGSENLQLPGKLIEFLENYQLSI